MSRVGKKPIQIPDNVEAKIEKNKVLIKGPKGELSFEVRPEVKLSIKDKKIIVSPLKQTKQTNALWGTTRALLFNMVHGVVSGYEKKLEIQGVGYRAAVEGKDLNLSMGFTNPVKIKAPEGINFLVEKNIVTVSGINKELVGQISSKIRKVRPPEPYKGKGIRYLGEIVRKKAGKKAATTG